MQWMSDETVKEWKKLKHTVIIRVDVSNDE